MTKVVAELRRIRLSKGLSVNRLAWMSGICHSALGYIEAGERSPTLRVLFQISLALEVELGEVIQEAVDD